VSYRSAFAFDNRVEDRANVSLGIAVKVGERSIQSMMSKAKMKETKGMPCLSRLGETCLDECGITTAGRMTSLLRYATIGDETTLLSRSGRDDHFGQRRSWRLFFSPSRPRRQKMEITQEGKVNKGIPGQNRFLVRW
jgi:hypothetical protein